MCVRVFVYVCMCTYVYMCVLFIFAYVCLHVCMEYCVRACACGCMCPALQMCMHVLDFMMRALVVICMWCHVCMRVLCLCVCVY